MAKFAEFERGSRVLAKSLLRIDPLEVTFARRGFTCRKPEVQNRLEHVGQMFLQGYHLALGVADTLENDKLEDDKPEDLVALAEQLNSNGPEFCGFAYEGAAMALALQDALSLRGQRFQRFASGPGRHHSYMLHVGYGWACARLPWQRFRLESAVAKLDPVLRALAIDGFGFHEGYFHGHVKRQTSSRRMSEQTRHIFFQGQGRSLWFVHGADAEKIAGAIAAMPPLYQSDAWSGVGLACAYAGGMLPDELEPLRSLSGVHVAAVAQGVAFAAKARQLAGNPATHTENACVVFCRMSAADAAALCDQTFNQLSSQHLCPYQQWRELLRELLLSNASSSKPLFSKSMIARGKTDELITSPELAAAESS